MSSRHLIFIVLYLIMGRSCTVRRAMISLLPGYSKNIPSIALSSLESSTERPSKRRKLHKYEASIDQDRWLLLIQDIWFCILQQLDVKSLVLLRATSKGFRKIENNFQNKYKEMILEEYKLSECLHVKSYSFISCRNISEVGTIIKSQCRVQ